MHLAILNSSQFPSTASRLQSEGRNPNKLDNMKLFAVLFCFVLVLFSVSAQYSYCGEICRDSSRIVCAYNQICHDYFTSPCEMKKRNCNNNDRFMEVGMASCLMSRRKCR